MAKGRVLKDLAAGILLATGATALRYICNPILGGTAPLLFHVLAVAVAAEMVGRTCGFVVTGLSAILIDYFFLYPLHTLGIPSRPHDQAGLLLFAAVSVTLTFFGAWRRRIADELKRAHERIALKHEVARMGSYEWHVPEDRMEWSPEMEEIYGIQSADHVHTLEEWKTRLHPDDRNQAVAGLEEAARRKLPTFDDTYRIIRPDGQIRWIHTRRRYQYDSHGNPLCVIGINMDVTGLKQGEMAQQILGGLLQICSACRRIHDPDNDQWYSMEGYLREHTKAKFSHGMCTDCARQWYPQAEAGMDEK